MERHEKGARYITVTLPLCYRYITVTSPLHHGYSTTTPRSAVYHPALRCLPPHSPLSATPCPAVYHPMPRWLPPHSTLSTTPCLPPHAPLPTTPCPAVYYPMPRWLPPHTPMWRSEGGACCSVAAVKTRRRRARTLGRVRGAGTGMEPSLGHDRCGSL